MGTRYDAVADLLDTLRGRGVRRAQVGFDTKGEVKSLDVEFEAGPLPVTPFRDASGKPVDLDEGAGMLTKDPDDDRPAEEPSDRALERANFHRSPTAS